MRTSVRLVRVGLFLLSLLVVLDSISAQPVTRPTKKLLDQYHKAAQNTVEAVWSRVRPVLSAEQAAVLARIAVRIDPNSWDMYGLSAPTEKGTIEIPLGLIVVQDYIDSAVTAQSVANISNELVMSYISAFTRRLGENVERRQKKLPILQVPEFPRFAELDPPEWSRIVSNPRFESTKDAIKLNSFAFMLLHEFAHHLEPDLGFEVREGRADEVAVDIGIRAGFNPMLAFMFFMVFAQMEEGSALRTGNTHEPSLCRGVYLFNQGRLAAAADPGFMAHIKKSGLESAWEQAPAEIRKVLEKDGFSCRSNVSTNSTKTGTGPLSQAESVPSAKVVAKHRVRLKAWRPTPGQCNGVKMEIHVDGEYVGEVNNLAGRISEELRLEEGVHEFSLESVSGYCVEPFAPFGSREFISDESCSGTFQVRRAESLQITVRATADGIEYCSIR